MDWENLTRPLASIAVIVALMLLGLLVVNRAGRRALALGRVPERGRRGASLASGMADDTGTS